MKDKSEAAEELDITEEEAAEAFGSNFKIGVVDMPMLLARAS